MRWLFSAQFSECFLSILKTLRNYLHLLGPRQIFTLEGKKKVSSLLRAWLRSAVSFAYFLLARIRPHSHLASGLTRKFCLCIAWLCPQLKLSLPVKWKEKRKFIRTILSLWSLHVSLSVAFLPRAGGLWCWFSVLHANTWEKRTFAFFRHMNINTTQIIT